MNDWYFNIEEPIRTLVYELRNSGINTECSCGHRMYVQCQFLDKCETFDIIYNVMWRLHIKEYQVVFIETVKDGYRRQHLEIQLPDGHNLYQSKVVWDDDYIENKF